MTLDPSPLEQSPLDQPAEARTPQAQIDLQDLDLDPFETAILPILRHFLAAVTAPETQSWHIAYATAAERWGQSVGLAVAHGLSELLCAIHACREAPVTHCDALALDTRALLTADEAMILLMIRYMRRDNTERARIAVENVTHGRRDASVIRAGLKFAQRFHAGMTRRPGDPAPARSEPLRIVQ